jgi:hypothetical protein
MYIVNVKGRLERIQRDCDLTRLQDITRQGMGRWFDKVEAKGMAAATRNEYLTSMIALCNWAVADGRMLANPLIGNRQGRHQRGSTAPAPGVDGRGDWPIAPRRRGASDRGTRARGRQTLAQGPEGEEDLDLRTSHRREFRGLPSPGAEEGGEEALANSGGWGSSGGCST